MARPGVLSLHAATLRGALRAAIPRSEWWLQLRPSPPSGAPGPFRGAGVQVKALGSIESGGSRSHRDRPGARGS